jgi:hypothetical protein
LAFLVHTPRVFTPAYGPVEKSDDDLVASNSEVVANGRMPTPISSDIRSCDRKAVSRFGRNRRRSMKLPLNADAEWTPWQRDLQTAKSGWTQPPAAEILDAHRILDRDCAAAGYATHDQSATVLKNHW